MHLKSVFFIQTHNVDEENPQEEYKWEYILVRASPCPISIYWSNHL